MSEKVVAKARRMLDEADVAYDFFEHEPVYTSDQAAKVRGVEVTHAASRLIDYDAARCGRADSETLGAETECRS